MLEFRSVQGSTDAKKAVHICSRTLSTSVVLLERDEGEGGTDGRCPPSFLTKAGEVGETAKGWEAEGED